MTSTVSSLVEDLKRISLACQESKPVVDDTKVVDNRKKGADELFEELKNMIPDKVREYAKYGRKEARVFEFKFKDGLKRGNCLVKDLLTKGDVVPRLQNFLDTEHSDESGPAFFIYFSHIGRYQTDHDENKFGVFVNWDKESWPRIKERLSAKPIHGRPAPGTASNERSFRGGRGGFRGGRGGFRGGRGGGRQMGADAAPAADADYLIQKISQDTSQSGWYLSVPVPAQKDELPESHDE